jgi:transposase
METRQGRSFTDDYKRQAVDLVASSRRSIGSVAKELGLRDSVLRRWVELRRAGREPTAAARRPTTQATLPSADHAAEIARLQRENESAAYGARHSKKLFSTVARLCGVETALCYPLRLGGWRPFDYWRHNPRQKTWSMGACELESGDAALAVIPIRKMTIGIANTLLFHH